MEHLASYTEEISMCMYNTLYKFYMFYYTEFNSYDLKRTTILTLCYSGLVVKENVLMLGQFCVCHCINKTYATAETMAPP